MASKNGTLISSRQIFDPLDELMSMDWLLDDLYNGCALTAFLEVCQATGRFPPDSDTTRRRADQLYEDALAVKNARKTAQLLGSN
jgi:hypothetical protein